MTNALDYAGRGWHVFPVCHPSWDNVEPGKKGKRPATDNGLLDATTDADQIERWFGNGRLFNLGIRTGEESNLTVIDIDGDDGRRWYNARIACGRDFGQTYRQKSGRKDGGTHLFYKFIPGTKSVNGKIHAGIDIKSTGGYIIGAGSMHETGALYEVVDNSEVADAPDWLKHELIEKLKEPIATTADAPQSDNKIQVGTRNETLTSLAGSMRRKGFDAPSIEAALKEHAKSHCAEPMDEKEISAIAKSVARYAPQSTDDLLSAMFSWTDAGAGEMFAYVCGDKFRHVKGIGWLFYDGRRFNKNRGEKEARTYFIRNVARRLRDEALKVNSDLREPLERYARKLEATGKIDAALREAQCVAPIAANIEDFDADPWIFASQNVVINLKNSTVRGHSPEDNITQIANVVYDPDATCPRWDAFLSETFQGNQNLIDLNDRWYGHCLTGDVSEQVLPILHGGGGNGKNVHLDTICGLMGDYAGESSPDLLMHSKQSAHPTEIADLHGKRLMVCSEPERGAELKISLVKRLTGNARLKARFMRQDFFEFDRTHKLVLLTNNKPSIKEDSHAVWRRLRLIPYNYTVPQEKMDKRLTEKLKSEYSGILNRLLKGCLSWQRNGMNWPDEVESATTSYREEQNPVLEFISEACITGEGIVISVADLNENFKSWARVSGLDSEYCNIDSRRFGHFVTDAGFEKKSARIHGNVCKCWSGIGLRVSNNEQYNG